MTDKNIEFQIREDSQGQRLDVFLAEEYAEFTRSRIQNMIRDGLVTVNGAKVKTGYKLQAGDQLQMLLVDDAPAHSVAEDIELDVVYEDADIIVVNKPQGMVVHPSHGHYDDTLVNALLNHCQDLSGINGELRPGIVHRIDKDTSGVLVVAKNDIAHAALAEQWKGHNIKRVYCAILCGMVQEDAGTVEAAIGRSKNNRLKMAVDPEGGRHAITHYQVKERFAKYTLVECTLETGRTHQIRVHMAYLNHPVAGDPLYGRKKDALGRKAQYLHARVLGFRHPASGEYMEFETELPQYFENALKQIREGEI